MDTGAKRVTCNRHVWAPSNNYSALHKSQCFRSQSTNGETDYINVAIRRIQLLK